MAGETIEIIMALVLISVFVGYILYANINIMEEQYLQDLISDHDLKIALFNNFLAAPCTNNDYGDRIEIRKLIVDKPRTEAESNSASLSCIDIGNIKYRIDIKDLQTGMRWTFSNYQPITPVSMSPDFDMIVQVNTNSETPEEEEAYIVLDEYHTAILTASIDTHPYTDKLQYEMFCDEGSSGKETIHGSASIPISHIYKYTTNNCESENCIKGPGQSNATCQDEICTYNRETDSQCTTDCECETFNCDETSSKCVGSIPNKLILGQPCLGEYADDCETGICAINKRCSDEEPNFAHITGKIVEVLYLEPDKPLEGVTVEIPAYSLTTVTDRDGDFSILNINLNTDREFVRLKITKDGYEDLHGYETIQRIVDLKVGTTFRMQTLQLRQV